MTSAPALGLPAIGVTGAFLGGLLALVSPCSALLLPSFFAYSFGRGTRLVARTLVFYVGLAAVLVPLGAGIGAIGSVLTRYRTTATLVGGVVMIALGVMMIAGRGFMVPGVTAGLGRLTKRGLNSGSVSILALGAVYGLAGFCAGPLLGAVLTVAAAGGSPVYGGALMGVYALGMTVPLFALALLWDRLRLGQRRWLRGREIRLGPVRTHTTSLVSGMLFAAIGVLFIATSGTANLGGLLGVQTEYRIQVWVTDLAGRVTETAVLFGAAVAFLMVVVARIAWRIRRERRASTEEQCAGAEGSLAARDAPVR